MINQEMDVVLVIAGSFAAVVLVASILVARNAPTA